MSSSSVRANAGAGKRFIKHAGGRVVRRRQFGDGAFAERPGFVAGGKGQRQRKQFRVRVHIFDLKKPQRGGGLVRSAAR